MIGKDLWEIVTGTETVSGDAKDAQKKAFLKKSQNQVLVAICLAYATKLQICVRSAETIKQAQDNLGKCF